MPRSGAALSNNDSIRQCTGLAPGNDQATAQGPLMTAATTRPTDLGTYGHNQPSPAVNGRSQPESKRGCPTAFPQVRHRLCCSALVGATGFEPVAPRL